jgi:crotonobetainyl-CoA:carnitine CoA-transferase CaiB-like acyl-CoA transferase
MKALADDGRVQDARMPLARLRSIRRPTAVAAAIGLLAAGGVATGAPAHPKTPTAAQVEALAQCVSVADDTARLACYDKAAKALVDAEKAGDVVVVDQAQVKEVKRQSFGFNINLGPLFDHGGAKSEQVNELATSVQEAWRTGDGKWVIRTAEGQQWRQIDTESLFEDPKKGDKVVIRRGSLGSYFLKVGNGGSIRAHRDE